MGGEDQKRSGGVPDAWMKWAFAAIPAAGLLELGAHIVQATSHVPDADWKSARTYVYEQAKADDLVVFAPGWVDPVGRMQFGSDLATLEREGRPDETRFPRAFEVSVHGAHSPALDGWRDADVHDFGAVTVTTRENPTPVHVLADLVSLATATPTAAPPRLLVSRVEGGRESECPFARGSAQTGGLGFGPAIPAERFVCPGGGFVGVSVMADLSYRPRRCVYAPALGGASVLRLRFVDVDLGHTLHGHHGLYVESERDRKGAPVTVTFQVDEAVLGSVVHHDGDGWKPFEFNTSEFAGKQGTVTAEITSPSGDRRMYCFEADTR